MHKKIQKVYSQYRSVNQFWRGYSEIKIEGYFESEVLFRLSKKKSVQRVYFPFKPKIQIAP